VDLVVLPAATDTFPAMETLFSEGGDPSWCWCMSFRVPGRETGRDQDKRELNHARMRDLVGEAEIAPGLIGFLDDRPVGWVSIGPRQDYLRLQRSAVYARVDDTPVWSIVCFVVSRASRGLGVSHALLAAAIEFARGHGATVIEAYPPDVGDRRLKAAYGYAGFEGMYQAAGFRVVATRRMAPTSMPRLTMRLDLNQS
jgi:GNAT superfamily N-acetyltransferase